MKTSIDISDYLFRRAKAVAQKNGTSVKALIEEGLRHILSANEKKKDLKPKLLTFGGDGLTDQFQDYSWEQVRAEIYRE